MCSYGTGGGRRVTASLLFLPRKTLSFIEVPWFTFASKFLARSASNTLVYKQDNKKREQRRQFFVSSGWHAALDPAWDARFSAILDAGIGPSERVLL